MQLRLAPTLHTILEKNMKFIAFLVFLVPTYLIGQNKGIDLSGFEHIDLEKKFELMDKIKAEFPFYSEAEDWPGNYITKFHYIDLDNDNDYDLIYDGWSGSEPMMVNIFINISGTYNLVLKQFMYVNEIDISDNILQRMVIYDPGCCAEIMEHWYIYFFESKPDMINCWLSDHFTYHVETTKPNDYFDKTIKFEVINETYSLRITPEIDNKGNFYPDDSEGNQIKTFSKGDIGEALAQQIDSTGRIWWYVTMNNKEKRITKTADPDIFPPKFVGWMSSRFLKVIE